MWEEKMFPGYTDNFVAECRRSGFRSNIVQRVASLGAIFPHVLAGDFISFTAAVARQLPHPGVALVPLAWPQERRPVVQLLWRSDDKYKALFEELAAMIAKKAAGRAG
jgi:DNA-binding transcriptional LysR family regulator